jgi:hypothetical protein
LEGGINLFVYVDGNPINADDPFGLAENVLTWPAIFWGAEKAAETAVTAVGTAAAGIATGVVAGIVIVFWPSELATDESIVDDSICLSGHKKTRPSTWDKHTKRRPGAPEKGDDYRWPPRKRPPGYPKKGPWPPK